MITYHSGKTEDWGKYFQPDEVGGRIVSVKLTPRSIDHSRSPPKNGDCGDSLQSGIPLAIPKNGKDKVGITYSYTVSLK